jgi:hypothetical protein
MVPSRIVDGTFRSIATWWDSFDMLSPPRFGATGASAALLRHRACNVNLLNIRKSGRIYTIW